MPVDVTSLLACLATSRLAANHAMYIYIYLYIYNIYIYIYIYLYMYMSRTLASNKIKWLRTKSSRPLTYSAGRGGRGPRLRLRRSLHLITCPALANTGLSDVEGVGLRVQGAGREVLSSEVGVARGALPPPHPTQPRVCAWCQVSMGAHYLLSLSLTLCPLSPTSLPLLPPPSSERSMREHRTLQGPASGLGWLNCICIWP